MIDPLEEFAVACRKLRRERGEKQQEFARACGVHRWVIEAIENYPRGQGVLTKHYLQVLVAFPDLLMDVAGLSNPSGKGRVRMTSEPLEPMGARMDRIERHIAALAKRAGVVLIA